MSRSTSQSSTVTGTTANGVTRSLSVKTNTKPTVIHPLPPSDIKLFVTNLRLLDFDRKPDWPNISAQTFSARNADQKQRIRAVEWSLFRLFEIWDPVETSQKLRPFFPPLEPLQSRNLRIALHRSLDALKKDGTLGREAVLRKTMLDECKGEKFYEILALFSTAVLKKVLASRPIDRRKIAVARRLATSTSLSSGRQESLLPLAIAHKAALVNVLKEKAEKRKRFTEFEALLDAKANEINQRIQKSKETPRARKSRLPQKEADAIKRQLKDNWIGNQKWLDVMLHGDEAKTEDAFLNSSFYQVWRAVENGCNLEHTVPNEGLLENLQSRVNQQQTRLQKWKRFQERLQESDSTSSAAPKKVAAHRKEFRFDEHLQIQLQSSTSADRPLEKPVPRPEYQEILSEMDDELARVATARHNHVSISQNRRRTSSLGASRSPARRRKSRSGSAPKVPTSPQRTAKPPPPSRKQSKDAAPARQHHHHKVSVTTPADSEATLVGHQSTFRSGAPASQSTESLVEHHQATDPVNTTSDPLPTVQSPQRPQPAEPPSPSPSPPPPSSYFPSEPPVLEPPSLNTEDALAAQIISSIGDATPSPTKKPQPRLSLMERTRMSMARGNSFPPISESPSLPSPPLPEPPTVPADPDPQQTLAERTRLSMAAMSARPRTSLAPKQKKRQSRQSIFPVNQFDTPRNRKSFQAIEEANSGEKTPKEDLFSDDVDYEKVFKSRPRLATSPVWGTPRDDANGADEGDDDDEFDEGVTGVDLADVDADEDEEGFTQAWESSPLRNAGRGRMVN